VAYDYLLSRDDIDPKFIVPIGWSLGGAVAIDLARRRPVAGLVTIAAFTNLRDMARRFISWLPMSLIMKYRFDNLSKLAEISCPILIVHGTDDELIPFVMSDRLAAAAGGKVTRFNVAGAGHNDVLEVGDGELLSKIEELLHSVRPTQQATRAASP
jgi:fermentation-respiration switch protein FrsA (DUF1100 family)